MTGALKAVADHLDAVFGKLGLEAFGVAGDPFDPAVHEAVLHDESDAVTEPTCTSVLRQGYLHRDRLLRPAMVGVSDPIAPPGLGDHPLEPTNGKHAAESEADVETLEGDSTAQSTDNAPPAQPHEDAVQTESDPVDRHE